MRRHSRVWGSRSACHRELCPATSSTVRGLSAEWTDLSTASEAITEAVEEAGIEFDAVGRPDNGR